MKYFNLSLVCLLISTFSLQAGAAIGLLPAAIVKKNAVPEELLDVIQKAQKLISAGVDANFIKDDLAVMFSVDKTPTEYKGKAKIRAPFCIIIFEKKHDGLNRTLAMAIDEFRADNFAAIKAIYFNTAEGLMSWRENKFSKEIACGCGCIFGLFSTKLCDHTDACPFLKKNMKNI